MDGWAAIAKFAGWTPRQLRNLEREGLVIHREMVGGRARVYAFQHELEAFFNQRQKYGSKKPIAYSIATTVKRHSGILPLLAGLAAGAIAFLLMWYKLPPKPENDIVHYDFVLDAKTGLPSLLLIDRKGHREQMWVGNGTSNQWDIRSVKAKVAFGPATITEPATVISVLDDRIRVYRHHGMHDLGLSLGSIVTEEGVTVRDLYDFSSVSFHSSPKYELWLICVNSQSDFMGLVAVLSRDLGLLAVLLHPGHVHTACLQNDQLVVSSTLNARDYRWDAYRPAVFAVDLIDLLAYGTAQVNPFSNRTLSEDRQSHYRLANVPVILSRYVAFRGRKEDHVLTLDSKSTVSRTEGGIDGLWLFRGGQQLTNLAVVVHFTPQLELVKSYIVDQYSTAGPVDLNEILSYQRWLGDRWGPWIRRGLDDAP